MGNEYFGLPPALASWLCARAPQRLAIETGTSRGQTAQVLAQCFERVITIERSLDLAREAASSVRAASPSSRVSVVCGNSADLLFTLLPQIKEPAVFWLDSHWFPLVGVDSRPQCSILRELEAIRAWRFHQDSIVLVDDMHLFDQVPDLPGYRPHEWPTRFDLDSEVLTWDKSSVAQRGDVMIISPVDF